MGWKSFFKAVAPVVAVVAAFVAPTLATSIGTSMGLAGTAAAAAGGAVIGGGTAALSGGNVLKGALTGGIGGAVSSGLQSSLGSTPVGEFSGAAVQPGVIQSTFPELSPASTGALARGLSTAGGSLASQLAGGAPLSQSLKQAGASGIAGGLTEYLYGSPSSGTGTGGNAAERQFTQMALSKVLSPDISYVSKTPTGGAASTGQPAQSAGPGSAALAQALRVDPGAPTFGGDSEGRQRKVWNVESLKLKDETGA